MHHAGDVWGGWCHTVGLVSSAHLQSLISSVAKILLPLMEDIGKLSKTSVLVYPQFWNTHWKVKTKGHISLLLKAGLKGKFIQKWKASFTHILVKAVYFIPQNTKVDVRSSFKIKRIISKELMRLLCYIPSVLRSYEKIVEINLNFKFIISSCIFQTCRITIKFCLLLKVHYATMYSLLTSVTLTSEVENCHI